MAELLVHGIANVVSEPKLNYIGDNKTPICNMNVAFNKNFKNKDGEYAQETCFVWVKILGKKAEYVAQNASLGQPLYIEGHMQMTKGDKGNFYTILVRQLHFCEKYSSKPNNTQDNVSNNEKEEKSEVVESALPF